jgi:hypothetical protein
VGPKFLELYNHSLSCHGDERIRDGRVWGGWIQAMPLVGNLRIHSIGETTPKLNGNTTVVVMGLWCKKLA